MAFTRDWSESNPVDHLQFKSISGEVRNLRVDISDRLKDILSGFTTGETPVGIKTGYFLTIGTGAPSAPSGTGTATNAKLYLRQTTAATFGDLYFRSTTGAECRMTIADKLCLDNSRLSNNTYILGTNTGGANVNLFRVNTGDQIEAGQHIFVQDTAPTSALQLTPKGYVDNKFVGDGTTIKNTTGAQVTLSVGNIVGSRVSKNVDTSYEATTDGIVEAYTAKDGHTKDLIGYCDGSNPPTTVVQRCAMSDAACAAGISFFVPKGQYYKVTESVGTTTVSSINFIALGS